LLFTRNRRVNRMIVRTVYDFRLNGGYTVFPQGRTAPEPG
jgi:hypothetical protein